MLLLEKGRQLSGCVLGRHVVCPANKLAVHKDARHGAPALQGKTDARGEVSVTGCPKISTGSECTGVRAAMCGSSREGIWGHCSRPLASQRAAGAAGTSRLLTVILSISSWMAGPSSRWSSSTICMVAEVAGKKVEPFAINCKKNPSAPKSVLPLVQLHNLCRLQRCRTGQLKLLQLQAELGQHGRVPSRWSSSAVCIALSREGYHPESS